MEKPIVAHDQQSCPSIRSSTSIQLVLHPANLTTVGSRAFSHAASFLWNSLPQYIQHATSITTFRFFLKTHLFPQAHSSKLEWPGMIALFLWILWILCDCCYLLLYGGPDCLERCLKGLSACSLSAWPEVWDKADRTCINVQYELWYHGWYNNSKELTSSTSELSEYSLKSLRLFNCLIFRNMKASLSLGGSSPSSIYEFFFFSLQKITQSIFGSLWPPPTFPCLTKA